MSDRFRAFAGIDWASQVHQVCAIDEEGVVLGERSVPHSGAGLASLGDWLITICQARPEEIAVAIEVPHGAACREIAEGFLYAIRLPKNSFTQESVGHLLTRPVGRPLNNVQRITPASATGPRAGTRPAACWPRRYGTPANSVLVSGLICLAVQASAC